jgi:hypothetical protein
VAPVASSRIALAERAIVEERFGGSRTAYQAALAKAGASEGTARGVIADEVRRAQIEARLRVASPSDARIADFYDSYGASSARLVQVAKPAAWLGHAMRGYALDTTAPPQVLTLPANKWSVIHTMTGVYKVRPLEATVPLGGLPSSLVRSAIVTALVSQARAQSYDDWMMSQQQVALSQTLCRRDELPLVDSVSLTDYLPFLALDSAVGW